jgi:CBS domain-containing protein
MTIDSEAPESEGRDEAYFDELGSKQTVFDSHLLEESVGVLPTRSPLIFAPASTVSDAMRSMQREHRGCVLISADGTAGSRLMGIFTERDVLFRIIDRGRNPATLSLGEVMVPDPESLPQDATVAWVLNKMSVGGFRHVPVVDPEGCPVSVVSVRDVVQFLVDHFPSQVLNLPPEPGIPRYRDRDGA